LEEFIKFFHNSTVENYNKNLENNNNNILSDNKNKPSDLIIFIGDLNLKILVNKNLIKIEFYENKPPHSRQLFIKCFETIFEKLKSLKNLKLFDINSDSDKNILSWLSILWTPLKCPKGMSSNSSFLTFYQFNIKDHHKDSKMEMKNKINSSNIPEDNFNNVKNNKSLLGEFSEIQLIGLFPIKFDNKFFLNEIKDFGDYNKEKFNSNFYQRDSELINDNSNMNNSLIKNLVVIIKLI